MPSSSPDRVPIETLLQHRAWVRVLARALVPDDHRAADVEQEVWRLAIERPPAHDRGLRAWFSRVVGNAARGAGRKASRRSRLEADAPAAGVVVPPDELVAAAELQNRLVRAVLRLEPTYRHVVLRRYFDGLTPTEIAARDGVALETVKTRLRRAREQLRRRMARRRDERLGAGLFAGGSVGERVPCPIRATSAVRGPIPRWARPRAGRPALLVGAGVMTIGCLLVHGRADGEHDPAAHVAAARDGAAPAKRPRRRGPPPPAPTDTEVPSPTEPGLHDPAAQPSPADRPEAEEDAGEPVLRDFVAFVVDTQGAPVAGARVTLDPAEMEEEPTRPTDARGRARFRVRGAVRSASLDPRTADGGALRARRATQCVTRDADHVRFVVTAAAWITGRARRENGSAFPFAVVHAVRDGRVIGKAYADRGGAFELAVPRGEPCTLVLTGASVERYPGASRNTPMGRRRRGMGRWSALTARVAGIAPGTAGVELIARPPRGVGTIRVRAERSDGRAVPGVTVAAPLGPLIPGPDAPPQSARTDATGRCAFEGRSDALVRLVVSARHAAGRPWERDGWMPAPESLLVAPRDEEYVLRFIRGTPLRGRVVLPAGVADWPQPVQVACVAVYDGEQHVGSARADADGRFVALVPASFEGTLRVRADLFGPRGRRFEGQAFVAFATDADVQVPLAPRVW